VAVNIGGGEADIMIIAMVSVVKEAIIGTMNKSGEDTIFSMRLKGCITVWGGQRKCSKY
jgi:hypothetical protein